MPKSVKRNLSHQVLSLNTFKAAVESLENRVLLSFTPHVLPRVVVTHHVVKHHVAQRVAHAPVRTPIKAAAGTILPVQANPISLTVPLSGASPAALMGAAAPPASAKTPAQMRGAYGMGQYGAASVTFDSIQGDGTGQTIAIIDAYDYPYAATDLHTFDLQFGLPDPPSLTRVNQTGGSTLPATDPHGPNYSQGTWEEEAALDIEWSHVMAPKASIILVECNSSGSFDMIGNPNTPGTIVGGVQWARQAAGVSVISMSFGFAEGAGVTSYDQFLTTPAGHQGITFLASTGDKGAPGGYPATSPNVVAVGGTALTVSGNSYSSESGWSGSGGGVSTQENQPAYQNGTVNAFSTTKRTIPDVSSEADPNAPGVALCDSWDFNAAGQPWLDGYEGGTSLAAPTWAGMMAVVQQGRALNGLGTMDGFSQTLPRLYQISSADFHDVTTGNNGLAAGPGYDLVTGRGTPMANLLLPDLASLPQTGVSNLYVRKQDSTHFGEWINSATPGAGSPTATLVLADASAMLLNANAGNDTLTLDFSNGDFTTGWTNIIYNASAAGNNSINFIGTVSNDGISVTTSSVSVSGGLGSTPIQISNISNVSLAGGSGGNDLITVLSTPVAGYNVNGDTASGSPNVSINISGSNNLVNFNGSQHLAGLTIGSFNSAVVLPSASSGGKVLMTTAFSDSGQLDLNNNVMIVKGGDLASLTALLTTGNAAGAWNGGGIESTSASNDATHKTALGIIKNNDGSNNRIYGTGAPMGTFDGENPALNDVLIKYTYYGDADLSGKVDGTDYGKIDNGFVHALSGWINGDFDYNNTVDGSDYSLIDNSFNLQGSPL